MHVFAFKYVSVEPWNFIPYIGGWGLAIASVQWWTAGGPTEGSLRGTPGAHHLLAQVWINTG